MDMNQDMAHATLSNRSTDPVSNSSSNSGSNILLKSHWTVWAHEAVSPDWTRQSYLKIYTIRNVSEFWIFFNSLPKLNIEKYQYYVMRDNILPMWEEPENRNGGTLSIICDKEKIIDLFEQLGTLIVHESFCENMNDINGVCMSVKQTIGLAKIWNKDSQANIINDIPPYIKKKYNTKNVYKINKPEY